MSGRKWRPSVEVCKIIWTPIRADTKADGGLASLEVISVPDHQWIPAVIQSSLSLNIYNRCVFLDPTAVIFLMNVISPSPVLSKTLKYLIKKSLSPPRLNEAEIVCACAYVCLSGGLNICDPSSLLVIVIYSQSLLSCLCSRAGLEWLTWNCLPNHAAPHCADVLLSGGETQSFVSHSQFLSLTFYVGVPHFRKRVVNCLCFFAFLLCLSFLNDFFPQLRAGPEGCRAHFSQFGGRVSWAVP